MLIGYFHLYDSISHIIDLEEEKKSASGTEAFSTVNVLQHLWGVDRAYTPLECRRAQTPLSVDRAHTRQQRGLWMECAHVQKNL